MQDPEESATWLKRLAALNDVIASTGEPLAGNLFYDHQQVDYLGSRPNPILREKRDRLRRAVASRTRMLEIGVNGGHSAYLALSSNPRLEFHGVDIGEHSYFRLAMDWLADEFPQRVFFYEGDCRAVLPQLRDRHLEFDVFHIDGAKHTYYEDILNCQQLIVTPEAVVIVDDTQERGVARIWRRCVRQRLVTPLPEFPSMDDSLPYLNEIGRLAVPRRWLWSLLRLYSNLLNVVRAAYIFAARSRNRLRRRFTVRA
jgi:hypothetical protein